MSKSKSFDFFVPRSRATTESVNSLQQIGLSQASDECNRSSFDQSNCEEPTGLEINSRASGSV